ncbi:hypothetical protein COCOBI_02-1630 [Coccomyxa sp. Obi]|nr:hypothetical protein COCOBI_02-1630 [Coccomyxa sp. Obi]
MQADSTYPGPAILSDDWFLQDYFPSLPMQLDQQGDTVEAVGTVGPVVTLQDGATGFQTTHPGSFLDADLLDIPDIDLDPEFLTELATADALVDASWPYEPQVSSIRDKSLLASKAPQPAEPTAYLASNDHLGGLNATSSGAPDMNPVPTFALPNFWPSQPQALPQSSPLQTTGLPAANRPTTAAASQSQGHHRAMGSSAEEQARGSGDDSERPSTEKRRNRSRSEREQTMNKLAQVRYRERKKAKAAELQAAVQALSERMQELTMAQRRNAELRARNAELQQALSQQMLSQQGASATASLQAAQSVTGPHMQLGGASLDAPAEEADEDDAAADEAGGQLVSHQEERLHDLILLLKDGMRGLKASSGDQQEPSCNPGFVQLVTEAAHCFVSVGCHQGIQSLGKPDGDPMHERSLKTEVWDAAVEHIQLTPDQLQQILQIRSEFAAKVDANLQMRKKLNAEALSTLSAQTGQSIKLEKGFFERANSMSSLRQVIKKLRANIRFEQDTKIQLGFKLLLEVLTPLQAAELLVSLFPVQCDCWMLLHALLKAPSTS